MSNHDAFATAGLLVRWCTTCTAEVAFEQPVCGDDHGVDCPEWVCVQCGDALLLGFDLPSHGQQASTYRVA